MIPHQDVSPDEERLLPLVMKIADGTPIDWSTVRGSGWFSRLQHLERLVRGHAACRSMSGDRAQADETLFTEARRTGRVFSESPLRVQWGPLVVFEKIGKGSFGDVYRAWDPRLDREVALKLIPEGTSEEESSPVVEEGRLLARVRHPNVLTVHGAERVDGRVGIWTEYVRGETLAQEVARRGPLPVEEAARIGVDVCEALAAVHAAGMLHRDVKAQNVFRDSSGRTVLGDFGTGIEFDDDRGVGGPRAAGTPVYLAPELFSGGKSNARTDLYSVGVLLYFLVMARFPVSGRSLEEIRRAHHESRRVPLRDARADLDPMFAGIVDGLLASSDDARPQTAAAAGAALRAWLERPLAGLSAPLPHRRRTGVAALSIAAAVVLLMIAGLAAWWPRNVAVTHAPVASASDTALATVPVTTATLNPAADPPPTTLNFEARDWVLITEFENRTGETLLDGTLEFALARELSNSAFVNVVPRERVEDVLELMRRPVDTKLDVRLGREVAIRDGGIRAVISGRVEKIGPTYAVTSQITNPADGIVVASLNEDAATSAELLSATRRQGLRVRESLGEMLRTIRRSAAELEKVTTPSLHAVQLYSQAAAFMQGDATFKPGPAEQLLTRAVAIDPEFASAHILLAWATQFQGRPATEFLAHARRALDVVARSSDVERYFIVGSHHLLQARALQPLDQAGADDQRRRAAAAYETLLRLKPDHYWGVTLLSQVYDGLRQEPEAAQMLMRRADLQPMNLPLRWWVVQRLFARGELDRGWVQLRRAKALLTPEFSAEHPEYQPQIQQLEAAEAWLHHDVHRVRELADALARGIAGADLRAGQNLSVAMNLLGIYNSLGRQRDARRIADGLPPDRRDEGIVRVLYADTNQGKPGAREALDAYLTGINADLGALPPTPLYAASLMLAGRIDALRTAVAQSRRDGFVQYFGRPLVWFPAAADARLALAEGRIEDAVRFFEEANARGGPAFAESIGLVTEVADAWVARGDRERAMSMLERATRGSWANSAANSSFSGYAVRVAEWITARVRLADLLRSAGRAQEAAAIEKEVLLLLAVADDDNPQRLKLQARQ